MQRSQFRTLPEGAYCGVDSASCIGERLARLPLVEFCEFAGGGGQCVRCDVERCPALLGRCARPARLDTAGDGEGLCGLGGIRAADGSHVLTGLRVDYSKVT